MRDGLANAWWSQVYDRAEDDGERLNAAVNLAVSLKRQGKYDEAEKMEHEVLAVQKRVLGAEHPGTLNTTHKLAVSLKLQGKHDEAEKMEREVLAMQKRVMGQLRPNLRIFHRLNPALIRGEYRAQTGIWRMLGFGRPPAAAPGGNPAMQASTRQRPHSRSCRHVEYGAQSGCIPQEPRKAR